MLRSSTQARELVHAEEYARTIDNFINGIQKILTILAHRRDESTPIGICVEISQWPKLIHQRSRCLLALTCAPVRASETKRCLCDDSLTGRTGG